MLITTSEEDPFICLGLCLLFGLEYMIYTLDKICPEAPTPPIVIEDILRN